MARANPPIDRYGSERSCAPVHAAEAALQGLGESISALLARKNPTSGRAMPRLTASSPGDNLIPGATVSTSAIRVL